MIRRQRVVMRTKVRAQRRKALGAVVALGVLGCIGFQAVQELRRQGKSPLRMLPAPVIRAVSVDGLADADAKKLSDAFSDLKGKKLSAVSEAGVRERLKQLDTRLRLVDVRRNWVMRAVVLEVAARKAMARCADSKRGGVMLDDAGELFESDELVLVTPEAPCASMRKPEERQSLARFLGEWTGGADGLALRTVKPGEEGWELELADGTRVRWGSAEDTALKQQRLKAVLEDARRRFTGILNADLRFFDQGKVLITPIK